MEFLRGNSKIYAKSPEGRTLCEIYYVNYSEDTIAIVHTLVDDSLSGKGIGKQMILEVIKYAKEKNLKIVPECSYAKAFFEKNLEYKDILKNTP